MPLSNAELEHCGQCGTPLRLSASAPGCLRCLLAAGFEQISRQFQHYEVELAADGTSLRELGRGAMGVTYRALDTNLGAKVALKVISARYSDLPEARARFRGEARAAAQLKHPNVAIVHHYGETVGNRCFYAMELVEGETLETRVRREGSLGAEAALAVAHQVAHALAAAEKQGLVHRDLKPSNLMLLANDDGDEPLAKVIDFGLAKLKSNEEASGAGQSGFSGTTGFASPEQCRPGARQLDTRSDIYSLGATLCYALCGRPPLCSVDSAATSLPLGDLRRKSVPEPLVKLLRRMLAFDPAKRPQSARELARAIEQCRRQLVFVRRKRHWLIAGGAFALIFLLAGFGLTKFARTPEKTRGDPSAKSIAVLPFENLSDDKANAYFATGVQDEILSDLAKIADLKVISRSSVMRYESGAKRDVRQIGESLGVANIVEGSVQRVGNRVRVVAQLIDARRDTHLWGETYDRDLADVFAIQDQIAQQIAAQLQARISPQERALIQEKPTSDLTAYAFYNQALMEKDNEKRIEPLEEAIRRDPDFILAYCQLGKAYLRRYDYQNNASSPDRTTTAAEAKQIIDTALRLRPDRGEPHLAEATYYFYLFQFPEARQELDRALRLLPNDAEAILFDARLDRHANHWESALAKGNRAAELDPHNALIVMWTQDTYFNMRRYKDGEEFLRRAITRNPGNADRFNGCIARLKLAQGDLLGAGSLSIAPKSDLALEARIGSAYYARDYDAALEIIAAAPPDLLESDLGGRSPDSAAEARVYRARGDRQKAEHAFVALRQSMDETTKPEARNEWYYTYSAIFDAGLGRKEDAIREARAAVDLHPIASDPINGTTMVLNLALVYAWTGEHERAIEQLEAIAHMPSGLNYGDLRFNPDWDSLRGDPRFEKVVTSLRPASSK